MLGGDAFGFVGKTIEPMVRVDARIGEGTRSVVYRGRHDGRGQDVAIKFLKLPAGLDPKVTQRLVDRLAAETAVVSGLSDGNPDIVRTISSGAAVTRAGEMMPYLVLELLAGKTLAEDLQARREAGMPGRELSDVIAVFEPAVLALEHAHSKGVVHRDIKPSQFFLAEMPGGAVRIKLRGFGLAKVLLPDGPVAPGSHAFARAAICAPAYGAPEQFEPKRLGPVETQTDVYSLALVLLEVLAGRRARNADTIAEGSRLALDAHSRPQARTMGIDMPVRLESLFDRCVALDKNERPKDAGVFWGEVKHILDPRRSVAGMPQQAATVAMPGAPTLVGTPTAKGGSGTVIMPSRPPPPSGTPARSPVAASVEVHAVALPPGAGTAGAAEATNRTAPMPLAPHIPAPTPAAGAPPLQVLSPRRTGSPFAVSNPRASLPVPGAAPALPAENAPTARFASAPAPSPSPPPTVSVPPPSATPSRVAAAGAIAFIVTLVVLLSLGVGAYKLFIEPRGAPSAAPH